jgi:hypothetical protein
VRRRRFDPQQPCADVMKWPGTSDLLAPHDENVVYELVAVDHE